MSRLCNVIGILVWLFWAINPASGNDDQQGSRDHPLFPRVPHYHISSYEEKNPASHDFQMERLVMTTVEGRGYKIGYRINPGIIEPSALEVSLYYQNAIKRMGGTVLYVNRHSGHTYLNLVKGDNELWLDLSHDRIGTSCKEYTLTIVEKGESH